MNKGWKIGLLAAGCAGVLISVAHLASQPADDRPVLRVSLSLAEEEWALFRRQIIPAFERDQGCRVEAVQVDRAELPRLLEAGRLAGKVPLDLFAQDNMMLAPLVRKGLVQEVSSLERALPRTIYPSLLALGEFQGKRYFVPFRPNVQIFIYNVAKFRQYGLRPPKSWQEWLDIARTFKQKEGIGRVLIKGAGGAPTVTQMYEFIIAAGGDPFRLDHPGTRRTFGFFQRLWKLASPDSKRAKFDTSNASFALDSVYLMQNWPMGHKLLVSKYKKRDVGVFHGFPGPKREAHVIGGDVFGIPLGSENRALAERFIQHLLSKEVQALLVRELGWPSARSDAYGAADSPVLAAVKAALEFGVLRENVPYWPEYQKLFGEAFRRVVVAGEALATLDELQVKLEALKRSHRP